MGRCGTLHAWEQEDVIPDLQTIGKGLGGGYAPVSGVLIRDEIVQTLDKGTGAFRHGQTYQGHPISCAAALAVQRVIREEKLLENVRAMGDYLEKRLGEAVGGHANVGDIRGRGLFWGVCLFSSFHASFICRGLTVQIEFVKDKITKEPFPPSSAVAWHVQETGMKPSYGISIYAASGTMDGTRGDHVILAPPYIITKEEADIIVDTTARIVDDVFAKLA